MKRNYLFLMSAALLLQTSCSSDSEQNGQEIQEIQEIVNEVVVNKTPGEIVLTETQRQMAADNCSFSFNLMLELSKNEKGNMVVSPISVGYMLGMLNDGANGTTSEEMMKVLGFGTYDTKAVNEFFGNLMTNAPLVDENVELGIANMLIANSSLGADFAGQYSADMKGYYQAAVESMDFNKADELVNHVNGWCDEKTRGMIPKILEPEDINSSIVAMLLNSVFFKAQWLHPFGKEFTSLKNFTNADGSIVKLPMMENLGGFEFASDELVQAIRLPYKDGHFSMVLIMPTDPGMSLDQLLGSMTDTYWLQLLDKMSLNNCHLQMPRFDISTTMDLMEPLSTMGMKAAFRNGQADFKRMFKNDAKPIFINLLKQKAKIQVDEYGTTAAAVTYSYLSGGMPSGAVFNANRPFLYIITENDSKVIFFIGKVADIH